MNARSIGIFCALAICLPAQMIIASEPGDIVNYREYSETLSSSGQPDAEQLGILRASGFERVVNIAFSDHDNSPPHEDRLVKDLGMDYVHVPVVWDAPAKSDFYAFAGALQRVPG